MARKANLAKLRRAADAAVETAERHASAAVVTTTTNTVVGQLVALMFWLRDQGYTDRGAVRISDQRIGGRFYFG